MPTLLFYAQNKMKEDEMSEKLTKLSPEQEKLMIEVRDEWINRCLGGDDTITTTQEQINFLYSLSGFAPPKMLIVDSPMAANMAAEALTLLEYCWGGANPLTNCFREKRKKALTPEAEKVMNTAVKHIFEQVPELFPRKEGGVKRAKAILKEFLKEVGLKTHSPGYFGLSFDAGWLSFYDFFTRIGIVKHEKFNLYKDMICSGIWGGILFESMAIIFRRPREVHRDERFRLHCTTGPAISWRDGFDLYFIKGIGVEKRWVTDPGSLSVEEILNQDNIEVRRTMIELLGYEKFCQKANFKLLDEDVDGGGQKRKLLRLDQRNDEAIVLVNVNDPSTGRSYYLRVPPAMKTCSQAVAWTYGETVETYAPKVEA